jgi:hypothetical protein
MKKHREKKKHNDQLVTNCLSEIGPSTRPQISAHTGMGLTATCSALNRLRKLGLAKAVNKGKMSTKKFALVIRDEETP